MHIRINIGGEPARWNVLTLETNPEETVASIVDRLAIQVQIPHLSEMAFLVTCTNEQPLIMDKVVGFYTELLSNEGNSVKLRWMDVESEFEYKSLLETGTINEIFVAPDATERFPMLDSTSRAVGVTQEQLLESREYTATVCEGEVGRLLEQNAELRDRIQRLEMLVLASGLASIRSEIEDDIKSHGLILGDVDVTLEDAVVAYTAAQNQSSIEDHIEDEPLASE